MQNAFVGKSLRIFLSYSSKDKSIAGKIKRYFEGAGIEVFLAHEDISPSSLWEQTIIQNLKMADIFMPLISRNFKSSDWSDQESGIAEAMDKKVIPLSLDILPYGFLAKYQAQRITPDILDHNCGELISQLRHDPIYKEAAIDCLIRAFAQSYSFESAKSLSNELLANEAGLTDRQVNDIVEVSMNNSQIYESYGARDNLRYLVDRHRSVIRPSLLNQFQSVFFPQPEPEKINLEDIPF